MYNLFSIQKGEGCDVSVPKKSKVSGFISGRSSVLGLKGFFLLFLVCCLTAVSAQTTVIQNFTSDQAYTVPCGVKEIKVEAVGGGGGGGRVTNTIGGNVTGGGGGGAYASSTISVSPGDTFNVIIGNGGPGTDSNNNGGDSSFINFNGTIVLAKGGNGVSQNSTSGANGGSAAQSLGDTKFSGGNGGKAEEGFLLWSGGGGGGGAGRPTQNGGNGGDGFIFIVGIGGGGGSSSDPGGAGGRGADFGNERGDFGQIYGGGGGGSATMGLFTGSRDGGMGASGVIRITYTVDGSFQPPITEIEQINLDNDAIGCLTDTVTIEADGGSLGNGASTLWFEGNDCLELAHIEEFTGFNFAGKLANATFEGITDGVARLQTTSNEPGIDMTNIFSSQIDPVKYKYISIRYKVVGTQSAGNVEIYFKRNGQQLSEDRKVSRALISDDNYHIMNIDMSGHGQWNNDGGTHNITGWRFDFATEPGRTIMIDYILLSSKPLIETTNNHNSNDTVLTYTLDPGTESKTIGSMRIAEFLSTENHCDFSTQKTNCTYTTLVRKDKTYQGTGDWSEAAKWTFNSLPISGSCVRIPSGSFATVNIPDAIAGTLIVNPGGKLEISDGSTLLVENEITNQATANDFVVKHDGNLIQIEDNAVNTGDISVHKTINLSTERKQYNFLSSPVVDANRTFKNDFYFDGSNWVASPSVQQYNTATYYFDEVSGQFISGKGYAVKEAAAGSAFGNFKGVPFNGLLNYSLSTAGGAFNLVGNPYPSNLDIQLLYYFNSTKINPTFYFWDNRGNTQYIQQGSSYNGDSYAKYNAVNETGTAAATNAPSGEPRKPTKDVKVGTGFMVQAITAGTLDFKNAYRSNDNSGPGFFGKGQNFDEPQRDRYWLTMTAPSEMTVMNAVVYFDGGKDDFWIDDTESFGPSDDLFTIVEDKQLSIQGKSPFNDFDKVPLGYKAFEDGYYFIQIFDQEGVFAEGQMIYILDRDLNILHDLSNDGPYKFLTRHGEFTNRFTILYRPTHFWTNSETISNQIDLMKKDNQIVISSSIDKITEVEVFDLNSRSVYKKTGVNSKEHSLSALSFKNQIIVVTVKTDKGEFVTKKFVNN